MTNFYDSPDPTTADVASELYPLENAIKTNLDMDQAKLGDRLGLSPEDQAAERQDFLKTMQASGLENDVSTVLLLHRAWTDARLAASRSDGDESDVSALADMNEETWKDLRLTYGKEAHAAVARTQTFVVQHPLLATILGTGTIGSRRDVVEKIMQHVQRHGLSR